MTRYNPAEIEPKWQSYWREHGTYAASDTSDKQPYYALSFFPYPSGSGLHIGHTFNFTITDVVARHKRMQGYEVLHPMGWDAFGLPAENYAIKTGIAPQVATRENIENFRRQCQKLGLSIDWSREFSSTDPDYYRWTQYFFLLLFKRGLAYQKESAQFWCELCKTVLANEQVVNGCCWRHEDTPVTKKLLKQWFFKITDYADRLVADLDELDWPEGIKQMQRNWIGRSSGAEIRFAVSGSGETLTVFTTRPDTLYGATFMVVAPEHPIVSSNAVPVERRVAVDEYVRAAQAKTDVDRMDTNRDKTGVPLGLSVINPLSGTEIPVWVADYVLGGYGTGAIMAVPAHDERDYAFATAFDLPVVEVIERPDAVSDGAYAGDGIMKNSGPYNGSSSAEAREQIVAHLARQGNGEQKINYKIRDWLISRQRYWGAPIPMIHCEKDGIVPVPEDQLPVKLPKLTDFQPSGDGRSPLAAVATWVNVACPTCGGPARRETDTMDGFACSSWYAFRFADPHNGELPFSRGMAQRWLPVDMYVGGAEHAVMHLLYARMWTKVMQDAGMIDFSEPFQALRNQGMIQAEDGSKMSKSKGNVVNPEDIIAEGYGADALRMTVLFLAPYNQSTPWSSDSLAGMYRFLGRLWTLAQDVRSAPFEAQADQRAVRVAIAKAVAKVSEDIQNMGFNTSIAALMSCVNELYRIKAADGMTDKETWHAGIRTLAQLLAPFGPHLAEELWHAFAGEGSVHLSGWPDYDESLLVQDTMKIAVQVNGKVRGTIELPTDVSQDEAVAAALELPAVQNHLGDKKPTRTIYVPGRLVSLVVES